MQDIDSRVIDAKAVNGPYEEVRKQLLALLAGIRTDAAPTGDAQRLAGEGNAYPLTVDKNGYLRVTMPEGAKVEATELEVLLRIEQLLIEQRDLLHKIA